jgi:acyl-CoA thioester hydrolase
MADPFTNSGVIEDKTHLFGVRIYYEDTDFSGLVYHAQYLKFFERARTEFMRQCHLHHSELLALEVPLAFAVVELTIRYLAPARIDDQLLIKTQCLKASSVSFKLEQKAFRDGLPITQQNVHIVCIDAQGRPARLPSPMKDVIKKLSLS